MLLYMITQLHTFPYLDELDMIQSLSSNISVQYDVYSWLLSVTISQVQATYYRGVTPQTDSQHGSTQLHFVFPSHTFLSSRITLLGSQCMSAVYLQREGADNLFISANSKL